MAEVERRTKDWHGQIVSHRAINKWSQAEAQWYRAVPGSQHFVATAATAVLRAGRTDDRPTDRPRAARWSQRRYRCHRQSGRSVVAWGRTCIDWSSSSAGCEWASERFAACVKCSASADLINVLDADRIVAVYSCFPPETASRRAEPTALNASMRCVVIRRGTGARGLDTNVVAVLPPRSAPARK